MPELVRQRPGRMNAHAFLRLADRQIHLIATVLNDPDLPDRYKHDQVVPMVHTVAIQLQLAVGRLYRTNSRLTFRQRRRFFINRLAQLRQSVENNAHFGEHETVRRLLLDALRPETLRLVIPPTQTRLL